MENVIGSGIAVKVWVKLLPPLSSLMNQSVVEPVTLLLLMVPLLEESRLVFK